MHISNNFVQSELYVQPTVNGTNGINGGNSNGSSRSQSTDPGSRSRAHGFRPHPVPNGYRTERKAAPPPKPQRVPSADEFPVLAGASTPPLRSPGASSANGWAGPTAAQVLQAPAPFHKDSQPGTRGASPANGRSTQPSVKVCSQEIFHFAYSFLIRRTTRLKLMAQSLLTHLLCTSFPSHLLLLPLRKRRRRWPSPPKRSYA